MDEKSPNGPFIAISKRFVLTAALMSLAPSISGATDIIPRHFLLTDPLFGLKFDPAKIVFETAPPHFCRDDEHNPHWLRKTFIFAQTSQPNGTYFITGGYNFPADQAAQDAEDLFHTDEPGAVYKIDSNGCTYHNEPDDAFSFPANPDDHDPSHSPDAEEGPVPASVMRDLVADAVRKYVKAWGSAINFRTALKAHVGVVPVDYYKSIFAMIDRLK